MLSRFAIVFVPRSKHLVISWLQSPSVAILKPKKIKSVCLQSRNRNTDLENKCKDTKGKGGG